MRILRYAPVFLLAGLLPAQTSRPSTPVDPAAQVKTTKTWTSIPVWPLKGCINTGKALVPGKAKTFEAGGRTFRTCCGRCQKKVVANPEKFVKKLDAAIIAQQSKDYPLTKCPISGKALDPAKAKDIVLEGTGLNNTMARLCCGHCEKKAQAKATQIAATIEAARHDAQSKTYPLSTCVVSGDDLVPGEMMEYMYGTRLVKFCCDDCIEDFEASPEKYLAALDAAKAAAQPKTQPKTQRKTQPKVPAQSAPKKIGSAGQSASAGEDCCQVGAAGKPSCCQSKQSKAR